MKRLFLILIALVFLSGCGFKLTERQFTAEFIDKLKSTEPNVKIYSSANLKVEYGIGNDQKDKRIAYLDNAYKNYQNGADLNSVIGYYVKSQMEINTGLMMDVKNLVPVIKDREYIEAVKQSTGDGEKVQFFYEDYADGLIILYAIDTPENILYLSRKDFQSLKISKEQARKMALDNLRSRLPALQISHEDGIYKIHADGIYESSLLLFDDIWSDLKSKVKGNVIITIPSRSVLLAAGSKDPEGIQKLKSIAEETVREGSYTLTHRFYQRIDGKWRIFKE